jgi:hypothetical protein
MDEKAAEHVLAYFRNGMPDDQLDLVIDFFDRHGQSLDWVFLGNPGGMICEGAARSKQAASLTDPIFELIERHRAADEAHGKACDALANAQGSAEEELADEREEAACYASNDAMKEIVMTGPSTAAGAAAMFRYFIEYGAGGTNPLSLYMHRDREQDGWEKTGDALLETMVEFFEARS